MKFLDRSQIPEDYFPYRSHSRAFFHWSMKNAFKYNVSLIEEDGWFGHVHHFFGGAFSMAYLEKCDIEPTYELFKKYGMKREFAFWSGWRKTEPKSDGWWKYKYFFLDSTIIQLGLPSRYWTLRNIGKNGPLDHEAIVIKF